MNAIQLDHRQLASRAFALIDPLQGDALALSAWDSFVQHPLTPKGFAAQTGEFPRLVDLTALDTERFATLIGLLLEKPPVGGTALCVALLDTHASVERIGTHLRHLLAPRLPQQRRDVFRFYDPVVMEHLSWMLDAHSFASLCGPIDGWLLPARGAWYRLTCPDDPIARSLPFRASVDAWQQIGCIGAIHAVLEQVPEWHDAPIEWGPRAEALLVRAERHQLNDRDDVVAFTCHGLRWHSDIDKHPRVIALLEECTNHPSRYRRLAGMWTDADWKAIGADLDRWAVKPMSIDSTNRTSQGACR